MEMFKPLEMKLTKYLFYTGKGGVGKTSTACATAVILAEKGSKVLLVSTDPASNLQDVFHTDLSNKGTRIKEVANLTVANLDPILAAKEYKENVVGPYRGKLPESVIRNMEEQLSGSCTVEIAAFNEFSNFITDQSLSEKYDYIIFDTAPTGHTLRMLQLPSAWNSFMDANQHGASCLGQLSGLGEKKQMYEKAVKTLSDHKLTTLILVTRADETPLKEAERASMELDEIGVKNQILLINGILEKYDDEVSENFCKKQDHALNKMPIALQELETYYVPLRSYNIMGIENIKSLLIKDDIQINPERLLQEQMHHLSDVIEDIYASQKKVIFTMGKGGVGKTTVAAAIALGLSKKGVKVHLTTTDPAAHLNYVISKQDGITVSHIDEKKVLESYKDTVLSKARSNHLSEDDIAYIEEDLKSPCTQEIAVFRAFAEVVERSLEEVVVIDTAPTGHTLLLLDSTQSYHKEVARTHGDTPEAVKNLLPRLRNHDLTEVVIVSLAETTPVYEAMRLEEDLKRAGLLTKWWVMNASLYATHTKNKVLSAKASHEITWLNKVYEHSNGNMAVIKWNVNTIKSDILTKL